MKRGSHLENKAIFAENLTKFYGKARGIDGLDLAVAPGEFFGFIGPNGAGKSSKTKRPFWSGSDTCPQIPPSITA